ncbi:MAG: hypothetical protein KGI50_06270 [Patescibacteria group bacterium]|nr:hypothetical protein [Patescibacteria group bacterium]
MNTISKEKSCPKCDTKALNEDEIGFKFGWRMMDGVKRPQSQCKSCRSGKKAHKGTVPVSKGTKKGTMVTEREFHDEICPQDKGKPAKQIRMEAAQELAEEYGFKLKPSRDTVLALADALSDAANQLYAAWRNGNGGAVVELSGKWIVCGDCSASWNTQGQLFRFTLDPKAAGWIQQADGDWTCQHCQHDDLSAKHAAHIEFTKKGCELRLGPSQGNNLGKFSKTYTAKQAQSELEKAKGKKEQDFWKEIIKGINEAKTRDSFLMGRSVQEKEIDILKKALDWKLPALPPDTVKI